MFWWWCVASLKDRFRTWRRCCGRFQQTQHRYFWDRLSVDVARSCWQKMMSLIIILFEFVFFHQQLSIFDTILKRSREVRKTLSMRRRTVSVLRPVRTHIHGCRADCVLTDARQLVEEQVYLYTYLVEPVVQANNKERLHVDCCLWFWYEFTSQGFIFPAYSSVLKTSLLNERWLVILLSGAMVL